MSVIWQRVLRVVFTSTKVGKRVEYSNEDETQSLNIDVIGTKYLAPLRDEFIISIYNLNYAEIIRLINQEFNEVEIYAGYKSSSISRIFKGSIFYISNERESRETNIVHIICVNNLLNLYKSKLNLTLNSGINMYAAINYVMKQAGVRNSNISEDFKRLFLQDVETVKGTSSSIVNDLLKNDVRYAINVDESQGATVSFWDLRRSNKRVVNVDEKKGMIINGFPTLTSDGLRFTSLPVFNYMPGDILLIENRLIDMSVTSLSEAQSTYLGAQLGTSEIEGKGEYLVFKLEYNLSNYGRRFDITLQTKSKALLSNIVGG